MEKYLALLTNHATILGVSHLKLKQAIKTMKKTIPILSILFISFIFYACPSPFGYPVKNFPKAYFPDTITNMAHINSEYDDINMDLPIRFSTDIIVFSSNRISQGEQFDIVGDIVSFEWDQIDGGLTLNGNNRQSMEYLDYLLKQTQTEADEYGPYIVTVDKALYLFYANNSKGTNDMYLYIYEDPYYYYNERPVDSLIHGPYPIPMLSSPEYNEAYFSLHTNLFLDDNYSRLIPDSDTINMVFCSDRYGQMDIYNLPLDNNEFSIESLLDSLPGTISPIEILNSEYNDRCPNVCGNFMVFSSDRPGGLGGYDFYYSLFKNGTWSEPVNFGAPINSAYDEYRAVAIKAWEFENDLLVFSSNRPGGMGGFDIYFTGIEVMPKLVYR